MVCAKKVLALISPCCVLVCVVLKEHGPPLLISAARKYCRLCGKHRAESRTLGLYWRGSIFITGARVKFFLRKNLEKFQRFLNKNMAKLLSCSVKRF